MSSYDLYAPRWAMPPDTEFKGQDENPFVGGEFVWTGFDYLGEPTPYNNDESNLLNFTDEAERQAKAASRELAKLTTAEKNACLLAMAEALEKIEATKDEAAILRAIAGSVVEMKNNTTWK